MVLTQKHEDQWNRIEDPDINLGSYNHLTFGKRVQAVCWRKDSLFNNWC
jgi:hypothetical protein